MLVYEKWVTESDEKVRHLYGTMENVPSDSDNQLVYQDADGDAVTPSLSNKYLDDGHGGIIMVTSDDEETFVAVNIKKQDNSLVNIVPGGNYEPAEKVLKSIKLNGTPVKTYTVGDDPDLGTATVTATFESGETEDVTSDCTVLFAEDKTDTATTSEKATADSQYLKVSYTYPAESGDGITQVTKSVFSAKLTINPAQEENNDNGGNGG